MFICLIEDSIINFEALAIEKQLSYKLKWLECVRRGVPKSAAFVPKSAAVDSKFRFFF